MKLIVGATSLALCLACASPADAQPAAADQTLTRLQEELARLPAGGNKERDDLEWRILIAKIDAKRASGQSWSLADFFNSNPTPPSRPLAQVAQPAPVTIPLAPTYTPPAVSSAVLSPMPATPAAPRLVPGTTIDRNGTSAPTPVVLRPPPAEPARIVLRPPPAEPTPMSASTPVNATARAEVTGMPAMAQPLEIRLPNGIALTVPSDISPEALKRLTSALSGQ